mmetsp:Transcript_126681/g.370138  ORF Transcript_126681/g.370138 Transcript_126681/m.370138 type:complete len:201 (-) Transcript_126681:1159-1761(-)
MSASRVRPARPGGGSRPKPAPRGPLPTGRAPRRAAAPAPWRRWRRPAGAPMPRRRRGGEAARPPAAGRRRGGAGRASPSRRSSPSRGASCRACRRSRGWRPSPAGRFRGSPQKRAWPEPWQLRCDSRPSHGSHACHQRRISRCATPAGGEPMPSCRRRGVLRECTAALSDVADRLLRHLRPPGDPRAHSPPPRQCREEAS